MPILTVKVAAPRSAALSQRISATLLDLTSRILGKSAQVTSIAIEFIEPQDWFVGGRSLAEQGRSSVSFDIKVTDETNTKAEKAQYIREAHAAFEQILGNLHPVSYIHVHDVRATAYGYGRRTQEHRFHHA